MAGDFRPKRDFAQTALAPPTSLGFAFRKAQQTFRLSFPICFVVGTGAGQFRPGAEYKESDMSWDIDAAGWTSVGVKIKSRWGKINNARLAVIDSKREILVSQVQELYEVTPEEAENQVAGFEKHTKELRPKVAA
ncbi:MAG: hypothetical protein ABIK25_04745 [Pseudomonadota bacterium]